MQVIFVNIHIPIKIMENYGKNSCKFAIISLIFIKKCLFIHKIVFLA